MQKIMFDFSVEACHQFLRVLIHGNPQADQLYGFSVKHGRKLLDMDFLSDLYDMFCAVTSKESRSEFINRMRYMGDK